MDQNRPLVAVMAADCRQVILQHQHHVPELPGALQPPHLLWMCGQIEEHAAQGASTRLHRWIGFIQAGMLANRMLQLEEIKTMFDEVKRQRHQSIEDNESLVDHLDPTSSFEFDIGGQG